MFYFGDLMMIIPQSSLRRAVCHPALFRNSKMPGDDNVDDDIELVTKAGDPYAQSVLRQLETRDNEDEDSKACPICFETMEDDQVLVAGCKHSGSVEPVILYSSCLPPQCKDGIQL